MFRVIGATLKKLDLDLFNITDADHWALTFDMIKAESKQLTHINLYEPTEYVTDQQYSEFLTSFHKTLE